MSEFEFWKDLGNIFDAVLNYQKKNVEFNKQYINPWIRLGNIFERQDQHNEAVQAYQHATELDPDTAQNWIDLGDAQFKNGAYDEAAISYQKAINLDPQSGWPLSNLALTFVTQGKYEEAIPFYLASIEILNEDKDKAISWNRLGNVYRKLNDYENAFLAFQRADELDGENTGFNDSMDENPPEAVIVAPQEILEQLIFEQQIESMESLNQEVIALAPNMEMKPEEDVVNEFVAEAILAVEETGEAIAEVAQEELTEVVSESVMEEVAEITIETIEPEAVTDPVMETSTEFETVVVEESLDVVAEIAVEEVTAEAQEPNTTVLQLIEDVIAKVEAAATFNEEKAVEEVIVEETVNNEVIETPTSRIPSWLIINDKVMIENAITEGEQLLRATELKNEVALDEATTTLSDVSQQATVSESVVVMDSVETYTEPVVTSLEEVTISEEAVEENAEQAEVKSVASPLGKAVLEVEEVFTQASVITEEISDDVTDDEIDEAAYEEYLKDVVEPTNILPDHVDEISEVPLTKVSEDGEVRIVMDTNNAHVWNELGNVYLNASSYDDAIAAYSKALELDRHFAWPYSNLALAYVQKGRFAEAILFYQRGIELFTSDKDKAVTWNRLGNVYRRMNDYDNAIAAYQTADELDSENATLSLRSNFGLLGNIQNEQKPAYIS